MVWSPLWRPFQLLSFGPEGFALIQHIKHDVFDGRGKVADDLSHRPAAQGALHVFKVGVEVVGVHPQPMNWSRAI